MAEKISVGLIKNVMSTNTETKTYYKAIDMDTLAWVSALGDSDILSDSTEVREEDYPSFIVDRLRENANIIGGTVETSFHTTAASYLRDKAIQAPPLILIHDNEVFPAVFSNEDDCMLMLAMLNFKITRRVSIHTERGFRSGKV